MVNLSEDAGRAFIQQHTVVATPSLVPEIKLHLATEITPLWEAKEVLLQKINVDPPYWAFAWPGGQALARYILDHPHKFQGKTLFDFGAGSGLGAIAALIAGAYRSIANDCDITACIAMAMNAALNNCILTIDREDWLDRDPDAEIILVGDMCYERIASTRILPWLRRLAQMKMVLLADPGRYYAPTDGLEELACYDVATSLELEDRSSRVTTVWRLKPHGEIKHLQRADGK
ncbi:MAG: 50S ribosomal protein L11 methyltransferase [Alphaproteobacteria bacterium]